MKEILRLFQIGVFILLSGCTRQTQMDTHSEITIPLKSLKITTDPQLMTDMYSMFVVLQLHRGLFRFLPDGTLMPDLVESWTESPDRKSYTFKLRKSVFSDGSALTAENVVWTFHRLFRTRSPMGIDMQNIIKGARDFIGTKGASTLGIRAIDDLTVEFELEEPSSLFLRQIAVVDCAILPLHKHLTDWSENLPTSGPYKLLKRNTNEIVVQKWRQNPYESSRPPFRVNFVPSGEGVFNAAMEGSVDSLANEVISKDQQERLLQKKWKNVLGGLAKERFVILNPKFIPKETRRWMFQQVKSNELIQTLKLTLAPAYGLIPASLPGALEKTDTEFLYRETALPNLEKLSFDLELADSDEIDAQIVTHLLKVWRHPSLNIHIKAYPTDQYIERVVESKSAAVIAKKDIDYPDGYSVLGYFDSGNESALFHASSPEIDEALQKSSREFDEKKRIQIYKEIQKMILSHFTLIPIGFGANTSGLWSDRLRYIPPHPMGFHTIPLEMIEVAGDPE